MANASEQRNFSENERITLGDRLAYVLGELETRQAELSAVLPPDISFDAFHATINQALRTNPDLLGCEARSLINACVKAGYDGLRVDGKEAVIVWEISGEGASRKKLARYMPMYQGLVQQVLRGGMVVSCEADVIYENDHYQLIGGTDRRVIHVPLCEIGADRGRAVAAYNVATLPSGHKISHWLLAAEIVDIQKESRSGWDSKHNCSKGVWKRWPKEQWKKTVLRQHRKTLPVGREHVIRDSEMVDEFPQFNRTPHPQIAAASAPPKPQRQPALVDNSATSAGVPLDMQDERKVAREQPDADAGRTGQERASELPGAPAEWEMWKGEIVRKIHGAPDADSVNAIWRDHKEAMEAAPQPMRDALSGEFSERLASLMTGGDAE